MRRVAGACIVAGVLAVFAAGCGGSTTTIIERTVTVEANKAPSGPALLKLPAYEHWEVEPAIYAFGVSGALAGHDLKWREWGRATARGVGRIWERNPDGDSDQYRKFPGEVVATGLRDCEGRQFYTEVSVQAEGLGTDPIELATPCTGGAPFDPSAVTGRAEGE